MKLTRNYRGPTGLGKGAVWLFLHRMDQVGKLDRVLDEENRDIVADDVPVALRVELHGETPYISRQVDLRLRFRRRWKIGRKRASFRRRAGTGQPWCTSITTCSFRKSRTPHIHGRTTAAQECVRGRSGRSSPEVKILD